jgi:predicted transcriptional regulator
VLNVTNSSESFIPIQRIINDKVKLTFNDYPEEAGITESTTKKNVQNISFNYDRTESDLSAIDENALSKYKMIDSITNVFDTLQTNRLDNQIWKWFVIFALLFSGN